MKFTCKGYHAVKAEDFRQAAKVYSARIAARKYGHRGVARTLSPVEGDEKGSYIVYSSFMGVTNKAGDTVGHNHRFTVYMENEDD